MAARYSQILHQRQCMAGACKHRLAGSIVDHADIGELDAVTHTSAERFRGRLLRGEALGEKTGGTFGEAKFFTFCGGEYLAGEAVAVAFPARLHARHLDNIGANAIDHRPRAARISRFISRTASAKPVNKARAIIAWPMFNSRTAGIAATAATL